MTRSGSLKVALAGATGWAGSALARGIHAAPDLELVAAVSRSAAGKSLGEALSAPEIATPVVATAAEALAAGPDVFVEYTKPGVAKQNVLEAVAGGANVVIGTSGLAVDDLAEIGRAADEHGRGVLACGNFAITAVLLQKLSEFAAQWIPHWEVIDYASAGKADAPSGTARELAHRLGQVGESVPAVPIGKVQGSPEARGARLDGTQVHSVRLPGYVIAVESIFGLPDQKLVLRHEAGSSAEPYVAGALLAIRKVGGLKGLHRGLDTVMG